MDFGKGSPIDASLLARKQVAEKIGRVAQFLGANTKLVKFYRIKLLRSLSESEKASMKLSDTRLGKINSFRGGQSICQPTPTAANPPRFDLENIFGVLRSREHVRHAGIRRGANFMDFAREIPESLIVRKGFLQRDDHLVLKDIPFPCLSALLGDPFKAARDISSLATWNHGAE